MKVRELFVGDVTRHIAPVVYFHEQSPAKLKAEVEEYIVTGGYPEGDPRAHGGAPGIHEQLVQLLRAILLEVTGRDGPELPASWISGHYGSGKSSFAKLLGLALDGATLPDETPLWEALLLRDTSPRRKELHDAWHALARRVSSIAVVFDIGGVARDNEALHSAALRLVQSRLGYCPKSDLVADYELRLERDGEWSAFAAAAKATLGKEWSAAKEDEQAEDHFSHVLHALKPDRYPEPTSWIDSRASSRGASGKSVSEVVQAMEAMVGIRQRGKSLFIVVDEVSQYVQNDESRMLALQSFVSELGHRLKGRVWLLATGQQKLDNYGVSSIVGKLKDRFPPHLRVHLETTHIRDVVHQRLLKKRPELERALREVFQKHRGDLKLHGYAASEITEDSFVDLYPILPGHIDLCMQIASGLRARSNGAAAGVQSVRGLVQLIGELLREQRLADREVGSLATLDAVYEVQRSALDADVQTAVSRIESDPQVRGDGFALRAAKAVALLEVIQDRMPTTPALVSACLYDRLGEGSRAKAAAGALEKLRALGLMSYSEKTGFKLQSSAEREWQRERDSLPITEEQISRVAKDALKHLAGSPERPRWKGRAFPFSIWFTDGLQAHDFKLKDPGDEAAASVDFRFLPRKEDRQPAYWVPKSDQDGLRNRLVWVVGECSAISEPARQLAQSEGMLDRHRPRRETLTRGKQRLLVEEEVRYDELERRVQAAVAEAFLGGVVYFRGQQIDPRETANAFGPALHGIAQRILPDLYPYFCDVAVSSAERNQLLETDLTGASTKFMGGGLGILSLDGERYVASCRGVQPARILQEIARSRGLTGQALAAWFVNPPYGYALEVVRACCVGLLRGKKIRVVLENGGELRSISDPGARDLFARERDFRHAEFFGAAPGEVTPRDRIAIRKFFKTSFQEELEPDDEPIADAAFLHFPPVRSRLRELERRLDSLPGGPPLPSDLEKLSRALEACCRSRLVQETVLSVKSHLDVLRGGLEQLRACDAAQFNAKNSLDFDLSKEGTSDVLLVETQLRGREVGSREQLQAALKGLEDRIGPLLDGGARVRLV